MTLGQLGERKYFGYTVLCKSFYFATPNIKFSYAGTDFEWAGARAPALGALLCTPMCTQNYYLWLK